MKRLLLVYGDPGHGKTTLANKLRAEHSFEVLSVDDLYVDFIASQCQDLYFPALDKFIAMHYQGILHPKEYAYHFFGRDFVAEWHQYLVDAISRTVTHHDNVVVEGYLLHDCARAIETAMTAHAKVFLIQVIQHTYLLAPPRLSYGEIAALGQNEENRETDTHSPADS